MLFLFILCPTRIARQTSVGQIFLCFFFFFKYLHLLGLKKKSDIGKYYYNLKYWFSILIYLKK